MACTRFQYFEGVLHNKLILDPNLGNYYVISCLACAVMCIAEQRCVTFNVLEDASSVLCQMTGRKAYCLEKEEVMDQDGCHMFRIKVMEVVWSPE